eukprot:2869694-Rhodomonas_salina.1
MPGFDNLKFGGSKSLCGGKTCRHKGILGTKSFESDVRLAPWPHWASTGSRNSNPDGPGTVTTQTLLGLSRIFTGRGTQDALKKAVLSRHLDVQHPIVLFIGSTNLNMPRPVTSQVPGASTQPHHHDSR